MADRQNGRGVAVRTEDWPAQASDAVVRVVGSVRDKTTGPAVTAARALVYGLVAAVLGVAAIVLVVAAAVRALDAYVPNDVWVVYAILGGASVLAGMFCWSRRTAAQE